MAALPELTHKIMRDVPAKPNTYAEGGMLRRRRYERAPNATDLIALTPIKVRMLCFLAECRFLSLPQLARLCCPNPRLDLSCKSARRQMRELFDAGLVDVLPVSRLALAEPDAPNDQTLLYGSAPNVYVPTPRGLALLHQAGMIKKELLKRTQASYGPKNSLFLAHELAVRDVRVWLEEAARVSRDGQKTLDWKDGTDAILEIENGYAARPDAWFVYQVKAPIQSQNQTLKKPTLLVGLVEVDRGSERGGQRWGEKLKAYQELFASSQLQKLTGYVNARILVFTSDIRRRDHLAEFITENAGTIAVRFWLVEQTVLSTSSFTNPIWRQSESESLRCFICN